MDNITPEMIKEAVFRAVSFIAGDVSMEEHPEGVSITDGRNQAYLFPARHGVLVEIWRAGDRDARLSFCCTDLDTAVIAATGEVLRTRRRAILLAPNRIC